MNPSGMTLKDLLGQVVSKLEGERQELNSADPSHPTHGDEMLQKFQAAYQAVPADPNADLGQAFEQAASAVGAQDASYTSRAYSDAFRQGAQQFQGRRNSLSLTDLLPIIGLIAGGLSQNNTRAGNQPSALGALAPLLGLLGGGGGGGLGGVLGGLGGMLSGGGNDPGYQQPYQQPVPQAQGGGPLGGLLGSLGHLFGGGGQPAPVPTPDLLSQLLGAARQGRQVSQPDAGAASTSAVMEGLLGAFTEHRA